MKGTAWLGEGVGAPPIQLGGMGECSHRSSISICSGLKLLKINTLSCNINGISMVP